MKKQIAYTNDPTTDCDAQNITPTTTATPTTKVVDHYPVVNTPVDNGKRQLFPLKLWDLVNLPEPYNPGVKWSDDGTKIIVDRQSLQNSYLKKDDTIFRTRSVDSFVRQLHFYGFRKTVGPKESDTVVYYRHECFQREKPDLLLKMKRQYKTRRPCTIHHQTNTQATAAQVPISPTPPPTTPTLPSPPKTLYHLDQQKSDGDEDKPVQIYTITDTSKPSDAAADAYAKALWPDQLVLLNSWRGEYHYVEAHFIYNPKRY